jgi:uncharacterized membrane protein YhaH (DUF805 family)
MNWYLEVLKKYAMFSGRARRSEYWVFALFNTIIMVALQIFVSIMAGMNSDMGAGLFGILYFVYVLAVLVPSIAVTIRRLHDTGRSGWWLLLGLIPLVGAIVLLIFLVTDSLPQENQYGSNPKQVTA